jgi:hypothetical protein
MKALRCEIGELGHKSEPDFINLLFLSYLNIILNLLSIFQGNLVVTEMEFGASSNSNITFEFFDMYKCVS